MDGSKCILQVRGVRPFLSTKYDIEKHHNYRYLSDFDPKKAFDIAEFVKVFKENRAKLLEGLSKKNTRHIVIEINEDKPTKTPAPPTSTSEVKSTEQPPSPASAEPTDTATEPAATQNETVETPTDPKDNQSDNQSDNYNDEDDDSSDFDPDDTELY